MLHSGTNLFQDKMTKPSKAKPCFFKVLIGDFSNKLSIPPAFIKRFDGRSLIGEPITVESPTGQNWAVTVEENGGRLFFSGGWQKFVKDHSLEAADFLVFKYYGQSKFKVKIFDNSCCEKFIYLPQMNTGVRIKTENLESDNEDVRFDSNKDGCIGGKKAQKGKPKVKSAISSFRSKNPCFITTWTEAKFYSLTIPRQLAVEQGLMNKKQVVLKDPSGKGWTIKLRIRDYDGRLDLKERWAEFCRANKIVTGNTLIFEVTKPNVMQVHVFREKETIVYQAQKFDAAGVKKGY